MKTYSIAELKRLSKEQGYKLAALENNQSERLQSFNNLKTKIDSHLNVIASRLKSELYPDGIYYVLMAQSINKTKSPDRYPITKGVLKPEHLEEKAPVTIVTKAESVLTWDSALSMQKQISDLTAEVTRLKFENNLLQSELDNIEDNEDNEGLSETKSGTQMFLSETLPSLMPVLDRWFQHEDKKLDLERLKLQQKTKSNIKPQRKPIVVGSQEHLNIIEHYYNTTQDDKLSRELDRLEAANFDLYKQVCEKLKIDIEEEEEEEEGQNG